MPKQKDLKPVKDAGIVDETAGQKVPTENKSFEVRMNVLIFTPDKVRFSANLRFNEEYEFQAHVRDTEIAQLTGQAYRMFTVDKELVLIPSVLFKEAIVTFVR